MSAVPLNTRPGIVDLVLGVDRRPSRRHGVVAGCAGAALCTLLLLLAARLSPARHSSRDVAARVPLEIALDEATVSLPPAPERQRGPVPRSAAPSRAPIRDQARAPSAPPAPAAAAVAQDPPPGELLDMTEETLVVGAGSQYPGEATAAQGTGTAPGEGRGPSAGAVAAGPVSGSGAGGGGPAAPVFLASQSWSCPWPSEADPLPIDEETVVIRVVVRSDGTAESVAVVSDPGHGFGQAAASCAMRTPFVPARAPGGEPIRATSAPIRVRFTR